MNNKLAYILSIVMVFSSASLYAAPKVIKKKGGQVYKTYSSNKYVNKYHVKHLPKAATLTLIAGVKYWVSGANYYQRIGNGYILTPRPHKVVNKRQISKPIKIKKVKSYYHDNRRH